MNLPRSFLALLTMSLLPTFSAGADATAIAFELDVPFLAGGRSEKLDVYHPANRPASGLSPAVVWIHGGGWTGGTKSEARAKNICDTLARAGYLAVSIDYKLGDGAWPTNLHDCKEAVRFLRANAARYRIDPERIAVAGGSAGGHLALMVALTAGDKAFEPAATATLHPGVSSAVRCAVNFYGITNLVTAGDVDAKGEPTATRRLMEKSLAAFGAKELGDSVLRNASPIAHLKKDSPPLLTFHGREDPIVDYPQAEQLERVARERGARHELLLLDGVGHSFDLQSWSNRPLPRDLRPVMLEFLARNLR
jgi:acetyl esterase/lipase